ncbi:hypothetical protein BDP27DRAFT_1423896 [Rhodocollybia butyracea]|uniref:Uncharacterized protein n=1 Tax=Rhodocollybia butyracea TaxID=206335 RepID=A0A9P5P7P0_9AGAR|nr:hypothetical protein BDP27DRAFT_1454462 [Rhodocollybia butyracea]KAF9066376.1 hypothetical protein BDP27DRAFT_1423896 [Rhodocollybia butyracea]
MSKRSYVGDSAVYSRAKHQRLTQPHSGSVSTPVTESQLDPETQPGASSWPNDSPGLIMDGYAGDVSQANDSCPQSFDSDMIPTTSQLSPLTRTQESLLDWDPLADSQAEREALPSVLFKSVATRPTGASEQQLKDIMLSWYQQRVATLEAEIASYQSNVGRWRKLAISMAEQADDIGTTLNEAAMYGITDVVIPPPPPRFAYSPVDSDAD